MTTAPQKKLASPISSVVFLVLILILALGLRLWGIGWALPNAGRWFSYHVDESVVVTYSRTVNPLLLLLDPGFYNYGSLSLLLNGLFIHLGEWFGKVGPGPSPIVHSASALLTARLVTAALGVGTCGLLYGAGRLLYGPTAGLVAALCYAVAPLAVQHGHFATVDVPATFWVAGSLYFALRHGSPERRVRDLLWAGVWAGLAAATKYNMALVVLAGVAAWWQGKPRNPVGLMQVLGGAVLGFLIGCPGVLLNFPEFIGGLADEASHVRLGHGMVFTNTAPGFVFHLTNLANGLHPGLFLLCIVGFLAALRRREPTDIVLLAFTLPYYLLIGIATVKFARYTLPLYPPLFLLVAALVPAIQRLMESSRTVTPSPSSRTLARLAPLAIALPLVFALLLALALDKVMTEMDPRDQAAAFIKEKGFRSVGFATGPWFNAPPLQPSLAAFNPGFAKQMATEAQDIRLIPADGEWNAEQLVQEAPDAVNLSEINEYADAERIQDAKAMTYLKQLLEMYPHHTVFANPVTFFGIPFFGLSAPDEKHPLPTLALPHDMNYTNPTTIVFYK